MLADVIAGAGAVPLQADDDAGRAANGEWRAYLIDNVVASETIRGMRDAIRLFQSYAPRVLVSKCIDGRVHGSDAKGYPPTTVTFSRTDGNRVALTPENTYFWNRVNGVMLSARRHTPDCPALFIALGHFAELGTGCAAHGQDRAAALAEVAEQARRLRARYRPEDLFVLHGMTNTDDGAEMLVFPDGRTLDTAAIVATLDTSTSPLRSPADVFAAEFLAHPLDDPPTDRAVGRRAPGELLADGSLFDDLQTRIAMEDYLLREVTQIVRNRSRNNVVFAPRVFTAVRRILECVRGLPDLLQAPLTYQTLWNVAWTLHERCRLPLLTDAERVDRLQHCESKVGYGEGFEIERRNRLVLAKPGRGDDQKALTVARDVLAANRRRLPRPYPPLVHINLELAGDVDSWDAFDHDVLAQLQTRIDNVEEVFGADCRILTTYSRAVEKCFYPISADAGIRGFAAGRDSRLSFPVDVTRGLSDAEFTREQLFLREQIYRQMMLMERDRGDIAALTR